MKDEDNFPDRLPYPASVAQRIINNIIDKKEKAITLKKYRNNIFRHHHHWNTPYYIQLFNSLDKWLQEEQYKLSRKL